MTVWTPGDISVGVVDGLTVLMNNLGDGIGASYAFFNNISYTKPKVPTLYSDLSSGDLATNAEVYGEYTHPMVLGHNQVVVVVLNNADTISHPFHLHGHNFQLLTRSPSYGAHFYDYMDGDPVPYDPSKHSAFPEFPAK